MSYIPSEKKAECHTIIHAAGASAAAVSAGLAQIPVANHAVLCPIQVSMIIALGRVFEIELTNSAAEATQASMAAAMIGRTVSQVLVGWIPGIGNAINACTAAALTESMGWMIAEDFAARWAA